MSRHRVGAPVVAVGLLAVGLIAAACGGTSGTARPPTTRPSVVPAATTGQAVAQTRTAIEQALGSRQVLLQDPATPYRPGEAPLIARVPRDVYQAVLPQDPTHGYIVVYEFPDERTAQAGAEAQAAYVSSAVGRVQFAFGTQFVVRQLGRTVIFYADPPESPDAQAPDVAEALRTVGTEITVPS